MVLDGIIHINDSLNHTAKYGRSAISTPMEPVPWFVQYNHANDLGIISRKKTGKI